ncbi:hypothetical protein ABI582_22935 [Pseudomonas sp. SAS7]|uniref:hypothetical protein n=1 Tax=Pseudomonas sp. SAS7 TaxID=3156487 RepID=UPI003F9B2602
MNFTELPPAPNEKQLTAKAANENLEGHAASFLALNNNDAWSEEEVATLSRAKIADQILECSMSEGLFFWQLKNRSNRLYKEIKKAGRKMKLWQVYDILPKALGYRNYKEAHSLRMPDEFVPNLWPSNTVRGRDFLSMENFSGWPSEQNCAELKARRLFNKHRPRSMSK